MDSPLVLYVCLAGALFLVVCLGIGLGVVGAMVRTRNMASLQLAFEDRLNLLEGIVTREVKVRAGQARQAKLNPDPLEQQLIEAAKTPAPVKKHNWWETGLPRKHTG